MKKLSECTVLIVDDTEVNIDILVEALGDDYEIAVAMDGESALENLETDAPDIILLDIMMPGMDGYEVCQRLKMNKETAEIPIIFLTAMTDITSKTKGFELGAVDYITKPFEILEVKARVLTHLSLKLAKQELAQQNKILKQAEQELRRQHQMITESIQYAAVIQHSILPEKTLIARYTCENFVFWQPKDIVGGDFYWFAPCPEGFMVAVIDCTGHGVPGAFMTLAVSQMLKRIVNEWKDTYQPAEIITLLDELLREAFYANTEIKERLYIGLDMALLQVNTVTHKATFSGARLPIFHQHGNVIQEIAPCRRSVGYEKIEHYNRKKRDIIFENCEINYAVGDKFYLATDGFFDQHGSGQDNPFGIEKFLKIITDNSFISMQEQKTLLQHKLKEYMGTEKQRDDITVIGFTL